ncbi:adenosine receptor A2b-like [Anneissia japonica]|uniref:adenosine receptor A2b-like n=1 Tax=Anneissia japonica TaxID=1529436 RepID=UPI00142576B5|nr:adenosine receptor A2b-like [Anneissia japonica]
MEDLSEDPVPVNNTNESNNECESLFHVYHQIMYYPFARAILPLIYILLAVCISLNTLNMVMIAKSKILRQKHNIFIFLLALSDCVGVFCLTAVTVQLSGHIFHPYAYVFSYGFLLTSSSTVCVVALDRSLALVWAPLRYASIVTTNACKFACVVLLVCPTTCLLLASHVSFDLMINVYAVLTLVIIFLNGFLYTNIYYQLCKQRENFNVSSQEMTELKKLLKTFSITVGMFAIAWSPFAISTIMFNIIGVNCRANSSILSMVLITNIMSGLNTLANPIIYAFRLTELRKGLKSLFICRRSSVSPSLWL